MKLADVSIVQSLIFIRNEVKQKLETIELKSLDQEADILFSFRTKVEMTYKDKENARRELKMYNLSDVSKQELNEQLTNGYKAEWRKISICVTRKEQSKLRDLIRSHLVKEIANIESQLSNLGVSVEEYTQ